MSQYAILPCLIAGLIWTGQGEPAHCYPCHRDGEDTQSDTTLISLESLRSCRHLSGVGKSAPVVDRLLDFGRELQHLGLTQVTALNYPTEGFAILDTRNWRLSLLSPDGHVSASIELHGGSQLPFQGPLTLVSNGTTDSLLLWDIVNKQLAVFNLRLQFTGSTRLPSLPPGFNQRIPARYANGDLLVRSTRIGDGEPEYGLVSTQIEYDRYSVLRHSVEPILRVEGRPFDVFQGVMIPVPLTLDPLTAVKWNDTYVLDANKAVLIHISEGGGPPSLYRFTHLTGSPVTEDLKRQAITSLFASFQSIGQVDTQPNDVKIDFPQRTPVFDELFVDNTARVWLRRVEQTRTEDRTYLVVEGIPEHHHVCTVEVPRNFQIVAANDYVAGIWTGQDGSQMFRVYEAFQNR